MLMFRVWVKEDTGDQYFFEWKNRKTNSYLSTECFIYKKGAKERECLGRWQVMDDFLSIEKECFTINYIAELAPKYFKMKLTKANGEVLNFIAK